MLHIVQAVMWGVAETPQLFLDEEKAQTAYVECAKKYWEQRYSAYCEYHRLSSDHFASAQAFVRTIDVFEKSKINYWTFNAEELALGNSKKPLGEPGVEEFRPFANENVAANNGLGNVFNPTGGWMDVSPARIQPIDEPENTPSAEEPETDPETYTTPEWKTFVGSITRLCGGSKKEFQLLPREVWRQDVYSDRTSLEYLDWVADKIMKYKEKAKNANYSVIADPDSFGCYRFADPKGIASEDCCGSEWEAWCAAALHLKANRRAAAG